MNNFERQQAFQILWIAAIVIVVVLVGLLVYVAFPTNITPPTISPTSSVSVPTTTSTPSPLSTSLITPTVTSSSVTTPTPPAKQTFTVLIQNFLFSPATITVRVGDTVMWRNLDTTPHTVTTQSSSPVNIDSGSMIQNQIFSYTFTQPGTYNYYCTFHLAMKGSVIVQ